MHISEVAVRGRVLRALTAAVGAMICVLAASVAVGSQAAGASGASGFFTPTTGRLVDTRTAGAWGADTWHTVHPDGRSGIPSAGVSALVLSFTSIGSAAPGHLSAVPASAPRQILTTQLTWGGRETITNSGLVPTDGDGSFQVFVSTSTQVLVDVQGYHTTGSDDSSPGGYVPLPKGSTRLFDSRRIGGTGTPMTSGQTSTFDPESRNGGVSIYGVPSDAVAVTANITVTSHADRGSHLTVWPTATPRPVNSLNFVAARTTAFHYTVGLAPMGKFDVYLAGGGPVDVVIDLQGYYTSVPTPGAMTPRTARVFDSRAQARLQPNSVTKMQIAGLGGVPTSANGGIAAELVNLQVLNRDSTSSGYLRVWGSNQTEPATSNLNIGGAVIRSNTATVVPGRDNTVWVRYVGGRSAAPVDLVVDAEASYANSSTASLPGVPQSVSVTASDGSITVSFSPPDSDGGARIYSYTVTVSPNAETVTAAGSPVVVAGLSNGTAYVVTITATNAAGTGAASPPSDPVTPHHIP